MNRRSVDLVYALTFALQSVVVPFLMISLTWAVPAGVWASDSVTDEVADGQQQVNHGNPRGSKEQWVARLLEEIQKCEPVPLPESVPSKGTGRLGEKLVSYNIATGEETIHEYRSDPVDGPASARSEGGRGLARATVENLRDGFLDGSKNFSDLTLVPNPEDDPWRVNCKLIVHFPGQPAEVGSGILIDPLHVLTAGHCVYDYEGGGGWAQSIEVIPAFPEPVYGNALGVYLMSWTGWTQSGDYDHDMGVIQLDRPVGALTGWHEYGYNNDDSFFTDNTFHNPGYPDEDPYDGMLLYTWYGDFDEVGTYQIKFNNRSYSGQSGSGAYHSVGSTHCVYAALSNGRVVWPSYTRDVRITPVKFGDIEWFINDHTPSTFDLIPLDVAVTPEDVNAGDQLSSMSYVVHNYSSASWSGAVDVDVYLSTDPEILPSDTPIHSHTINRSLGAKSSELVIVSPPPTIPPDVSAGFYYVGVILDITDADVWNNQSNYQDAAGIYVHEFVDNHPPQPDPMHWGDLPIATSTSCISLLALTATDESPPVEYYFDCMGSSTGGGGCDDSGWQTSTSYIDCGLEVNHEYEYRVKARDAVGNETGYCNPATAYTLANTPDSPTVSNPGTTTLDVDIDPNGNPWWTLFALRNTTDDYYVAADGGNNGDMPVYQTNDGWGTVTVLGLSPGESYTFRVKGKNGDGIETVWGPIGYGTTQFLSFVTDVDSVSVPEGGTTEFHVRMNGEPSSAVDASVNSVSGDPDISVQSGNTLLFTTSNWNTYQPVTLAAAEDSDPGDGQAEIRIQATSGPPVLPKEVVATELDNDHTWYVATTGDDVSGDGSVSNPFATIQRGLDAAGSGDTVLVACGTYTDCTHLDPHGQLNCLSMKSGVCLRSESGNSDCVTIDADSLGRVVYCENVDATAVIEGFAITGGFVAGSYPTDAGAGMYCYGSSPTVIECTFSRNCADLGEGGAVHCRNGSSPSFVRCRLTDNVAGMAGGISCRSSSPALIGCTVARNTDYYFSEIWCWDGSLLSMENTIVAFSTNGSGLYIENDGSNASLVCCNLYGNAVGDWLGPIAHQLGTNGNISEDPLFCDPPAGDYCLLEGSPCIGGYGCGQIGAFGLGCFGGDLWRVDATGTPGVNCDCSLIQACVDSASAGDTVLVASGVYMGEGNRDISFGGKSLVLRSERGSDSTIIHCEGSESERHRGFHFIGEGERTVLRGFTIEGGYAPEPGGWQPHAQGGAIRCSNSSLLIEDCTFQGNCAPCVDGKGGAICCWASSARIRNCTFLGNSAYSWGGGMCFDFYSSPTITDCLFSGNSVEYGEGGAVSCGGSFPPIGRCVFLGNSAFRGGGMYCSVCSSLVLTNCVFVGNSSGQQGAGIYCSYNSCPIFENTIIASNTSGEAVSCDGTSTATLNCCDVFANDGGDWVGCLAGQNGINGNISADPLFCNPDSGDFSISEYSPCEPSHSGCGLIGADSVGCALTSIAEPGQDNSTEVVSAAPTRFFLGPAIPNPFNPATEITYGIPPGNPSHVVLNIYDCLGRTVKALVAADREPGTYTVAWDGKDQKGVPVASGVYFYRISWYGKNETKRMVLLK